MDGAAILGIGGIALSVVAVVYRVFPSGYSRALCDQKHRSIDDKLSRQETDRIEILSYLRRIEEKLDDHIRER